MRPLPLKVQILDDGLSIVDAGAERIEAGCINSHHSARISCSKGDLSVRRPLVMKILDAHRFGMPVPFTRAEAVSVKQLCEQAGIPCRALGHHAELQMIALIDSEDNFLFMADDGPFYSIGRKLITEDDPADVALRALEIMAYTFHEYSARECLNRQNLFTVPPGSYGSET